MPRHLRETREKAVSLNQSRLNSSAPLGDVQPTAQPCVWSLVKEGRMKGNTRQPRTVCPCCRHAGILPHDPLGNTPSWKAAGAYGWQPYHIHVSTVMRSGSLNLPYSSGPVMRLLYLLPSTFRGDIIGPRPWACSPKPNVTTQYFGVLSACKNTQTQSAVEWASHQRP